MINTKVLLVADTIIHDQATNRMSVINIFEMFRPAGYPILLPRFTVFAMLERESADTATPPTNMIIKLDEDILFDRPIEINFGASLITRTVQQFQGFVIPRPGVITIQIRTDTESVVSYRIAALLGTPPQPQPQQIV
jgi:hypothetical protein